MDLTQTLLQILGVYRDNSELISSAVKDLRQVQEGPFSTLRRGYEERKRKLILKAVALLAPSDIPAKVVEVDGVDDTELCVLREKGSLDSALAIYLRHDLVAEALATVCKIKHGDALGFYVHSLLAAVWDHVELGNERLLEAVKPVVYECTKGGRQVLENARGLCLTTGYSHAAQRDLVILAFEAARDDHRRFALLTAVLMDSVTGDVMFVDKGIIKTSTHYTLKPSDYSGLNMQDFVLDDARISGMAPIEGEAQSSTRAWDALNVLCSMFAEAPKTTGLCDLINTMSTQLVKGLKAGLATMNRLERSSGNIWIPSRKDLQKIHHSNEEEVRASVRRHFTIRDAIVQGITATDEEFEIMVKGDEAAQQVSKSWILDCMADRSFSQLGRILVREYENQKVLPTQTRDSGNSSVFATYIYRSLGRGVVAEEYRQIFSSGKVNIRRAKSGTLIFVPHSGIVTMTTHGMVCKSVDVINSQIFTYESADRFALLPHLLSILGLRNEDPLLAILVREMDENAYLVADPMTLDVRACMAKAFETSKRVFRTSTLHEEARRVVGVEHYQGLVREAVSLLARLGATVPAEYVGRSCFYDITRDLKGYRNQSSQMQLLFDRGVTLDGTGCELSVVNETSLLVKVIVEHEDAFVIAPIKKNNLRPHQAELDPEMQAMEAAVKEAGLVLMKPTYEVYGELRLAVTRSDPGRGLFCIFKDCEAR